MKTVTNIYDPVLPLLYQGETAFESEGGEL